MEFSRQYHVPGSASEFAEYLRELRSQRKARKSEHRGSPERQPLSRADREVILAKTAARCHVCGGKIQGRWHADHVLAHSAGGEHITDNYLAAHPICNNYRWDYLPEEFQEIMRLGVWLRTQIEKETRIGRSAAEAFIRYDKGRIKRR